MAVVFERVKTEGVAQLSYLIGDDAAQVAAVVDPRPNVGVYLELARRHGVAITHVFETHIHADFMSGARELACRAGGAKLCVSGEQDAEYGFSVERIYDGDSFEFGSLVLTARHTSGHTPEHMAYLLSEKGGEEKPWGVLSGDALFAGSAGRPDLLGEDETAELEERLHRTLRGFFLGLDDGVIVYPCHGAGSACGADIGDRPMTTVGFERRTNPFLQIEDLEEFRRYCRETAPPEPNHYRRLKVLNAEGPPVLGNLPPIPALPPEQFREAIERGEAQLLDTRQMLAFGGGHIGGAINIGARPEISVWAGQMLDEKRPLLLVVEHEPDLEWVAWQLVYTGFVHFAGYLAGGMKAWENRGLPIERLEQTSVHELRRERERVQILDVRRPDEWEQGHIPGAVHVYLARLRDGLDGAERLDRERPVAVYCDSGYRADIGASILQARGFADVRNVPGSWQAWRGAGYETEG